MTSIDHFASTARGFFLAPGGLTRGQSEVSLSPEPVSGGALAVVEVVEVPPGCLIDQLEVVEPFPKTAVAWQTREVPLSPGQKLVVAIGGRFANRSISGRSPSRPCPPGTELDLLNKGGVSGLCEDPSQHVVKLKVLGGVDRNGRPTLLSDLITVTGNRSPLRQDGYPGAPIVLITGSDMEVGKTTCASSLTSSLRAAGIRTGYVKLTGTGRMRDLMKVCYGRSLGYFDETRLAWDFVDAGLASTRDRPEAEVRRCARTLLRHAAQHCEIVLAELADSPCSDGSLHVATDSWLQSWLQKRGLLICACDTVESSLIVHWVRSHMGIDDENILISGPVANDPALRHEVERMAHVATLNCMGPSGFVPQGGKSAGGAMADWTIRHLMARRRTSA